MLLGEQQHLLNKLQKLRHYMYKCTYIVLYVFPLSTE